MVRTTSSDIQEFSVPEDIACQSQLIKNMIEDIGDADEHAIPLPNVAGAILQKVIEHATMHKDDPPSAPETETMLSSSKDIQERDKQFLNNLLDVGCKNVANMIKGKTVEEVRALFNIVNDFTPEEEEQIRKENEWCEER
ncbi:Skp1 family, dimerization domain-containing protein [Chytriomyces cf. hyalinus JEL632]|nr:Skp1 family, dimerization domain-containing protein [Chytriomyces cf. hyalinus JEL632]